MSMSEATDGMAFTVTEQDELSLQSNHIMLHDVQFESRVVAAPLPLPNRVIHDHQCGDEKQLPGVLARSEGDPDHEDPNVNMCYEQLGRAFKFFYEVFGRNSTDGKGGPLVGVVNYAKFYPNATWSIDETNNQRVLVFGNGWQTDASSNSPANGLAGMFGGFVNSLEVVVHEMMHGISHLELNLQKRDEPGALDEHLSDVFGIMAEQWQKRQRFDEADWLIGEDCLIPSKRGFALRSFMAPGTAYNFGSEKDFPGFRGFLKDPQMGHFKDKANVREDYGGIHLNSGILNRGFYLLCRKLYQQGKHYSWDTAGQIWYSTLTSKRVPGDCTFRGWAKHTADIAEENFGKNMRGIVLEAWKEVGLAPKTW
jgi:Zn-dependent metalloprotease